MSPASYFVGDTSRRRGTGVAAGAVRQLWGRRRRRRRRQGRRRRRRGERRRRRQRRRRCGRLEGTLKPHVHVVLAAAVVSGRADAALIRLGAAARLSHRDRDVARFQVCQRGAAALGRYELQADAAARACARRKRVSPTMRVREAPTRSHTADEKAGRLGVGHAQKRGHRQVASPTTSHLTTRVEALGHADKH